MLQALAISLLLHLLLLDTAPPPAGDAAAGRPLAATLRRVVAAVSEAVPKEVPHRLATVPSPPVPLVGQDPSPVALPVPSPVAAPSTAVATDPIPAASPPPSPPQLAGGAVAPMAAGSETASGLDADGLRQYRVSLSVLAARLKRYPPRAREAGWTGTAEVRVAVAADGHALPPRLARSSGYDVIDEAALDMFDRAAQRAVVPESLRGRAFAVYLPVEFRLVGN